MPAMREEASESVLTAEKFIKKIKHSVEHGPESSVEVLPNWQLKLTIPDPDGLPFTFLGPSLTEMHDGDYTVFLSEVDILAGSRFAVSWLMDAMTHGDEDERRYSDR